ncbi:MAG: ABC transporter ATP-binding protein [Candidatus Saccharibacteria bacterium]|nr:ABC transporter ATP-binding protein [Candidatus Saccharibacteria bacterium]
MATKKDAVIKVQNVSKDFRFASNRSGTLKSLFTGLLQRKEDEEAKIQHALKDISFEIKKGEFFGIVGRNGSGKSTLLKMLAGIYQPSEGNIQVEGKLVPFIELGVGFNPELTGKENVYLNGALLGFSEDEVDKFYDEVVEFAELEQFMDKKLKNYSSGMQVRLAFSMAIRAQADILLIDEVLAVGDADFQRKCFEYFNHLKKVKSTVIFVSHDMEAIRQYCDRAVLVEDSVLIEEGSAETVAQAYTRQFTETQTSVREDNSGEDNPKRWGEGGIITKSVAVDITEQKITMTQTLQANEDMKSYIAGIRLKNTANQYITGTNTKIEHKKVNPLKAGETVDIIWEMSNILSDGDYLIDPAVLYSNEITVGDWWDDAVQFTVKRNRKIPYIIDPGFKVHVKDVQ